MPAGMSQADIDDAIAGGNADADSWLEEIQRDILQPITTSKNAGKWYQMLGILLPNVPPKQAEEMVRKQNPAKYDDLKKRFMEVDNGPTR